jgi:Cell Wall Hydrolase
MQPHEERVILEKEELDSKLRKLREFCAEYGVDMNKIYLTYDRWMAALCLWREARGSTVDVMIGIWWVLQNRLSSSQFPKTFPQIILQPNQFSSFEASDPNATRFPISDGSEDWIAFLNCQEVIDGFYPTADTDPTNGAVFYESLPTAPGGWWATLDLTVKIGPFRFYKEKAA